MASYTPNYSLKKPADADTYDIADANGNMDLIDTALHSQNEAITALNGKIGKVDANGTQCDTLSAVETYLLSIHNSLADGEIKAVHMLFTLSYTGQYFIKNSRYVGYYTRINNATGSVSLTNRTGDIIVVGLTSATSTPAWEYNSINSKIAEINKIDITGTTINITAYDSLSNLYTCPSDGYVRVGGVNESVVIANQAGTTDVTMATANGTSLSIFVRKGMKVYISNPSYARFISLQ